MSHSKEVYKSLRGLAVVAMLVMACGCGRQTGTTRTAPGIQQFMPEHTLDFDGLKITFVQADPTNLWVGKFEISNARYRQVFPDHSSGFHDGMELDAPEQPVVNVSWRDAKRFCAHLNKVLPYDENHRYKFRLPTEEEWMHFATCGNNTLYPWGDEWPPPGNWNYFGEENPGLRMKIQGHNDGYRVAAPVHRSGYNAWGIYGAGSNVKEWCENPYDVEGKYMTFKGGSWTDSHPDFLTTAKRNYYEPSYKFINLGFRVVAEVETFTEEEKAEIAEKLRKERERAEAEQERLEKERLEREQRMKELEERERRERRMLNQTEVQRLVNRREYEKAGAILKEYSIDFGKDDFYNEWHSIISNIKIIPLSEDVVMEFVRFDPEDLWFGRFEVTNKEFREFNPDHDSGRFREHDLSGPDQPVVNVSWHEATDFCAWLNKNYADKLPEGYVFRLPTEKEWETVAACGKDYVFPWGNEWPPEFGNYGIMADYSDGFAVTCPVSESGRNILGIYGMGGNVWEWVEDWYDTTQTAKVFKGAAWNQTAPEALKITNRSADSPERQTPYVGFRVIIGRFR